MPALTIPFPRRARALAQAGEAETGRERWDRAPSDSASDSRLHAHLWQGGHHARRLSGNARSNSRLIGDGRHARGLDLNIRAALTIGAAPQFGNDPGCDSADRLPVVALNSFHAPNVRSGKTLASGRVAVSAAHGSNHEAVDVQQAEKLTPIPEKELASD